MTLCAMTDVWISLTVATLHDLYGYNNKLTCNVSLLVLESMNYNLSALTIVLQYGIYWGCGGLVMINS